MPISPYGILGGFMEEAKTMRAEKLAKEHDTYTSQLGILNGILSNQGLTDTPNGRALQEHALKLMMDLNLETHGYKRQGQQNPLRKIIEGMLGSEPSKGVDLNSLMGAVSGQGGGGGEQTGVGRGNATTKLGSIQQGPGVATTGQIPIGQSSMDAGGGLNAIPDQSGELMGDPAARDYKRIQMQQQAEADRQMQLEQLRSHNVEAASKVDIGPEEAAIVGIKPGTYDKEVWNKIVDLKRSEASRPTKWVDFPSKEDPERFYRTGYDEHSGLPIPNSTTLMPEGYTPSNDIDRTSLRNYQDLKREFKQLPKEDTAQYHERLLTLAAHRRLTNQDTLIEQRINNIFRGNRSLDLSQQREVVSKMRMASDVARARAKQTVASYHYDITKPPEKQAPRSDEDKLYKQYLDEEQKKIEDAIGALPPIPGMPSRTPPNPSPFSDLSVKP